MSREPEILLLPENCKLYLRLIWWRVRGTASQNGAIRHINRNTYSIAATSKSCSQLFIAVFLFLIRKSKNDRAIMRNMLFMDPVWDLFPFYMRTLQSQTGTKVTRVGSATDTKSGRCEMIFRPVPCKLMKRNVWRSIRTHTGLSSSRSHVITPLEQDIAWLSGHPWEFGVAAPLAFCSLYKEAPPERGSFFMLQVCERVWEISLVEVYERSRKSAISACKKSHLKLKARLIGQLRFTNLFAQYFD